MSLINAFNQILREDALNHSCEYLQDAKDRLAELREFFVKHGLIGMAIISTEEHPPQVKVRDVEKTDPVTIKTITAYILEIILDPIEDPELYQSKVTWVNNVFRDNELPYGLIMYDDYNVDMMELKSLA
jgi:hypothetical protein